MHRMVSWYIAPETVLATAPNQRHKLYGHKYAGNNELQLWALIAKKPMVSLNAHTGVATLYKPDLGNILQPKDLKAAPNQQAVLF